jgi:hypothetical protein
MKPRWTALIAALLAIGLTGTEMSAQKGKKPSPGIAGGPSDAVFADLEGLDRIRSDGYLTSACASGLPGEESRYCGGTYTDAETGLTYGGVGPECSRISYGSNGDYSFRTLSSKCHTFPSPPLSDVGQRRLVLDFSEHLTGVCRNDDAADDVIERTVNGESKSLNVCGVNYVDDVRIVASGMFTNSSSAVTIYISLHAPPSANTTQFLLEFAAPIGVIDHGTTRELLSAGTAVLWEMVPAKNGRLVKAVQPVGEYSMPFSLTARTAPMPQ